MKHSGLESNEVRSACQLLKEDLIRYQLVGAVCWRPLPGEFDEVTQQVCPFVEGSLHLYYHVGSQHSWGMAGSVISRFFQRYVNIGPQDIHFYQHLIWIQFCFRCHVIISIHWHFLNFLFLKFSHRLQLHVPKRWHQTAPKLEPSFSLHDSTSGTSETQRRPSAGLANSSCHRSFRILELQFFSPHSRWINLEIDIQNLHHPNPSKTSSNDDVRGSCELGLHYAGDRTTNCISPPRFWFCFEMQPSLQIDRDGHQKRMI